jgi:hypothetical protein
MTRSVTTSAHCTVQVSTAAGAGAGVAASQVSGTRAGQRLPSPRACSQANMAVISASQLGQQSISVQCEVLVRTFS